MKYTNDSYNVVVSKSEVTRALRSVQITRKNKNSTKDKDDHSIQTALIDGASSPFLSLKNKSPNEIHRELIEVYGAYVTARRLVWFWFPELDKCRTGMLDEETAFSVESIGQPSLQP
ncbi:hypothetical protein TNCV_151401 [Trichonephila clavipes]|uniref:Uncharacterized protein n=1 Tax=Trichonephila clavipes TaxID=2585209 RepID=A0A8X6RIR9_TRICX|nr:hypothetical protein TNCV_151401 [Trichonephila clavipes]